MASSEELIHRDKQLSTHESSPSKLKLTNLALQKLLDAMQQSVKRMDEFITNEACNMDGNLSHVTLVSTATAPGTRGSISSGLEADIESLISSHPPTPVKTIKKTEATSNNVNNNAPTRFSYFANCPVDPHVVTKAANDMLEARKYILKTLQDELHPFLMKHVIARAVNDRNVQMVRLAIKSNVQILDFRALDLSIGYPDIPQPQRLDMASTQSSASLNVKNETTEASFSDLTTSSVSSPAWTPSVDQMSSSGSSCSTISYNFPTNFFTPPNEFDWFSRDKMGKILSLSEACELFSIIKMADCTKQLKEIYMNAKRAVYLACSKETLSTVIETLAELKFLTKLVLRGMCDDDMLKTIGLNMVSLKHLDVSGSQFVTDTGIQHLFFKENNQSSALYLISAWVIKNMDKMNPCTHSLIFLDYSWTCVTSMGRKMVQLLPGSYLFKRLMSSRGEHGSFGHHIFIRETPSVHDLIPAKIESSQCKIFEKHLVQHVGVKGIKSFLKIVEHHPWRSCILNLYTLKNTDVLMTSVFGVMPHNNQGIKRKHCFGIITPNQSEKRIQGIVQWSDGVLNQVYTIYPVNINTLGMLNNLRIYRGIVCEIWRMQYSLLPDLVHLDVFAEPSTFLNIIESCPSLRRLRVRIRRTSLNDDQLIKSVETSMCKRTLEDIWIAPGKIEDDDEGKSVKEIESSSTKGNASDISSFTSLSQKNPSKDKIGGSTSQNLKLVQLSLDCIEALIRACRNLKRLGDVSTWSEVEAEELYMYCEQLKKANSTIIIIWANMNLPTYGKKTTNTKTEGQ